MKFGKAATALLLLLRASASFAVPLTAYPSLNSTVRNTTQTSVLMMKGNADDNIYAVEIDPATGNIPVSPVSSGTGRSSVLLYRNDYSSASVTTAAYTQVTASTSGAINRLCDFDSSGSAIIIATGAGGAEVNQLYVPPGGSSQCYELHINSGTRIAIKALDVTASVGQIILTGLN